MRWNAMVFAIAVASQANAADFKYTRVEAGYRSGSITYDDPSIGDMTFDTFGVTLSVDIANNIGVYVSGATGAGENTVAISYSVYDVDYDYTSSEIGAFYHAPISGSSDIVLGLGSGQITMDASSGGYNLGSDTSDGMIVWAGVRSAPAASIELEAKAVQAMLDGDSATSISFGGLISPTPALMLGLSLDTETDGDSRSATFRALVNF